jgi:hypothetical protein
MPHKTQFHEQVGDDFRISMVGSNSIVAQRKNPWLARGRFFGVKITGAFLLLLAALLTTLLAGSTAAR